MELFLIRHAESKNNVRKNDFERLPDPELTKNGEIQSRHLAEFLQKGGHLSDKEFKSKNKPLDIVYCSAMKRSLATTRPIANAIDQVPEIWLDIHEVGGIYKFNSDLSKKIGLPGLSRSQIKDAYPNYLFPETFNDNGWWNKDAETLPNLKIRAEKVLMSLERRSEEDLFIGLVTHGAFISSFLCTIFNLDLAKNNAFQSHNCSVSRLTFGKNNKVTIQYLNYFNYLPDQLRVPRPKCEI